MASLDYSVSYYAFHIERFEGQYASWMGQEREHLTVSAVATSG